MEAGDILVSMVHFFANLTKHLLLNRSELLPHIESTSKVLCAFKEGGQEVRGFFEERMAAITLGISYRSVEHLVESMLELLGNNAA